MAEERIPPIARDALRHIREDRQHGASYLARAAAQALRETARTLRADGSASALAEMRSIARLFAQARPSMAPLANTAARVWAAGAGEGTIPSRLAGMAAEAKSLATSEKAWMTAIVRAATDAGIHGTVFTHSQSGTVEQTLIGLACPPARVPKAMVTTSFPGGEGVAAARQLAMAGVPVTLVADAAIGVYVPQADAVVVGADSIRADGSVVNKVGTYPLALVAAAARVPVYIVAESLKIAGPRFVLTLEQMDPNEILSAPVPGIRAENPYFDVTPAKLVQAYITEVGILDCRGVRERAERAGAALAVLRG